MQITVSFELLRDGRKVGGDRGHRAHAVVSTNVIDNCTVIHPFVDCFVHQVRVSALIDSGSMKSFISARSREQCNDPHLASIIDMKRRNLPKPTLTRDQDPALKRPIFSA